MLGVSPKDFKKISHPDPEILTSWLSGDPCTDLCTDPRTNADVPWVEHIVIVITNVKN